MYRTTSRVGCATYQETHGWDGSTDSNSHLIPYGKSTTNSGDGSSQSFARMLHRSPEAMAVALESIGGWPLTASSSASAAGASGTRSPNTSAMTVQSTAGSSAG